MTTTIEGIDVSTWQHPNGTPIDWEKAAGDGIRFVLVKATQGIGYANPWLERDIDDARAEGLLVGAYHYFEAGQPAQSQALNFVTHVVGLTLDLGAWLDWECYAPEAYTHSQEMAEFMTGAKEHLGDVGVYCDEAWAAILVKAAPPVTRLWVAYWGEEQPADALVWQFAAGRDVAGVPAPVDVDRLLSTRAVNLPTAPRPRPTAATVAPVTHLVDEEGEEKPG